MVAFRNVFEITAALFDERFRVKSAGSLYRFYFFSQSSRSNFLRTRQRMNTTNSRNTISPISQISEFLWPDRAMAIVIESIGQRKCPTRYSGRNLLLDRDQQATQTGAQRCFLQCGAVRGYP
jgi:hypothetical protein